jgi:AcrR family transcriptional regulator
MQQSRPKREPASPGGAARPHFDSIWTRPERTERARKPPLTRARIVQAAMELADERGLSGLSTRAIAGRLGAGPTSMYWHVPTTADLYELILDAVIGEIALPPRRRGDDWRAVMRELGLATLTVYVRHPWAAMLGVQPGIGPATRRYGEYAMQVFADAGVARDEAIAATAVINNYMSGFALRHAAWEEAKERSGVRDQWNDRFGDYVAGVAEQDPQLAAYLTTRAQLSSTEQFALGLDCVLDGIGRRFVGTTA